jgi:hypothetical protein
MEATRSMALASSTEVPPNFMTIMGGTCQQIEKSGHIFSAQDPSLRLESGYVQDDACLLVLTLLLPPVRSSEIAFRF